MESSRTTTVIFSTSKVEDPGEIYEPPLFKFTIKDTKDRAEMDIILGSKMIHHPAVSIQFLEDMKNTINATIETLELLK